MAYEFTAESFKQFSDDILGANGEQGALTTALADMQAAFVDGITVKARAEEDLGKVKEENQRLMDYNMQLYRRLGEKAADNLPKQDEKIERGKNLDAYLNSFFEEK